MSKTADIKKKTKEIQKVTAEREIANRASELGFTEIEDYKLWQALEDLRKATIADRQNRAASIRPCSPMPISLSGGLLDAAHVASLYADRTFARGVIR